MTLTLQQIAELSEEEIEQLPTEDLQRLALEIENRRSDWKQNEALKFYVPASEEARKVHLSTSKEKVLVGGNRSSKTETMLVDMIIQMTGITPFSLEDEYPREKIRTPIRARLVCNSLITTWSAIIKPKLQWWVWSGRGERGGEFGHWGWIPPALLKQGDWDRSWSEKERTLTLANGSTLQVMSYDQEVQHFAGASLHVIGHDEGPPEEIYRENMMRTLETAGSMYIAMTPPDDMGASLDASWVHDLYEKGLPGSQKNPEIDSFTLFTEDNRILDHGEIQKIVSGMSVQEKEVRLKGAFIHLSGRIYPMYTDRPESWCFHCNQKSIVLNDLCSVCGNDDVIQYCHIVEMPRRFEHWPCIMAIDPHPRKPTAIAWYCIDPTDDIWQVAELEVDDEAIGISKAVFDLEEELGLVVSKRLMDPNMGASPSRVGSRTVIRDEFDAVELRCDLADDNRQVAHSRLAAMLKPDPRTRAPRFHVVETCRRTDYQFRHYIWGEWARYSSSQRDPKPVPRPKDDDFPTLAGYVVNSAPTFAGLRFIGQPIRYSPLRPRSSRGGY